MKQKNILKQVIFVAGSSLQQAAYCYGIPKTVLWRRMRNEENYSARRDTRKSYDPKARQAAVRALQSGQSLSKVAQEYQVKYECFFLFY